jgi:hypothetical protein
MNSMTVTTWTAALNSKLLAIHDVLQLREHTSNVLSWVMEGCKEGKQSRKEGILMCALVFVMIF